MELVMAPKEADTNTHFPGRYMQQDNMAWIMRTVMMTKAGYHH